MCYEKKKLVVYRIVCLIVILIGIGVIIWVNNKPTTAKLIDSEGFVDTYESLSSSSCEIIAHFNEDMSDMDVAIQVAFFDVQGNKLDVQEDNWGIIDGKNVSFDFYHIDGIVDAYEIIGYEIEENGMYVYIVIVIGSIILLIGSISLLSALNFSCRIYHYENTEIIVYAGGYHHYIKVNGMIYDEHNTPLSYVPIYLSCDLEDCGTIDVTISTWNRISLKINNKLYNGEK